MTANKAIEIGGTIIKPGSRVNVDLPIADLYTSTSMHMPVQVICGRKAGPVLFVSAAIHGDELNGVEIIRRLLKRRSIGSLKGTLVAVPIVNVHGFLNQARDLPARRDLNRSFPGSNKGSVASRLADVFIKQIVSKADFGIDLHTGAINRSNLPQIRANLDDPKTLELARAFGVPVIINSDIRDGSLRACAHDRGMPVLIYESGEALRFDEISIRAGLRGMLNVMRQVGMLPKLKNQKQATPVMARSTRWVRASDSGIVTAKVKLGNRVRQDQSLALISSPLGDEESHVIAPFDGIVIGQNNLPLTHEGDALFHVAAFKSIPQVEILVENFAAQHDDDPTPT